MPWGPAIQEFENPHVGKQDIILMNGKYGVENAR